MTSRSGTFRSGAASGLAKILREEGSGPVVTAGTVASGLERMFMWSSVQYSRLFASLRAKRSNPESSGKLDCFGARAPRNDGGWIDVHLMRPLHPGQAIV